MAVIKMTNLLDLAGHHIQNLGENPVGGYRELLMAEPTPEQQEAGIMAIPYTVFGLAPLTQYFIRIPHAMSADAAHARIPDVVLPVLVSTPNPPPTSIFPVGLKPLIDATMTYNNGWFADGQYVYLSLENPNDVEVATAFMVYVEYTHSIIKNEIVTGDYGYLGSAYFGG